MHNLIWSNKIKKFLNKLNIITNEVTANFLLLNFNKCKYSANYVKKKLENNNFTEAVNFSRQNLTKQSFNIYHHIGIYMYKVSVLEKFVNFNQTKNEIKNRLEQLRALDNNIPIMVLLSKSSPIGIDTKEDYIAIKKIMEYKS